MDKNVYWVVVRTNRLYVIVFKFYILLKQYDFDEIIDKHRNLEIWKLRSNNWKLINKL